jgi:hypothetical protein
MAGPATLRASEHEVKEASGSRGEDARVLVAEGVGAGGDDEVDGAGEAGGQARVAASRDGDDKVVEAAHPK